jgi:hypothetical protein
MVNIPIIDKVNKAFVTRFRLKGGPTLKAIAAVRYYGFEISQTAVAS